ncbi:MAG: SRPBCC family protein [Dehalococcoidia bacterium]
MSTDCGRPSLVRVIGTAVAAVTLASPFVRRWYLRWGSTKEERERGMPLDESVPSPMLNSTMAISVDAPPEDVWPWLPQMGDPPRAGYYSYTLIERWAGMHIENGDMVLPEFQELNVGDALDKNGTMTVLAVEPGRHLVLGPPPFIDWIKCAWSFGVYPDGRGGTRLVTRVRSSWSWRQMLAKTPPPTWPMYLLIEPGAFLMERKMLKEIKRRAEKLAASRAPAAVSSGAG